MLACNEWASACDDLEGPKESASMSIALHGRRERLPFELRVGVVADIDTLCDIDRDASELFVRAGLDVELPNEHEFALAERTRWLCSLSSGSTLLAVDASGTLIGFAASGARDGEPYLDQLSVRQHAMQLGVGTALLNATEKNARVAGARSLWLTTYGHLSWNRPFYERRGFAVVAEAQLGRELLAELAYERHWLPAPEQRIVMRKELRPWN